LRLSRGFALAAVSSQSSFDCRGFWTTWLPFLTSTGALWMAITILALVAIRRRRVRSQQMLEAWDEEEEDAAERHMLRSTNRDPDDNIVN